MHVVIFEDGDERAEIERVAMLIRAAVGCDAVVRISRSLLSVPFTFGPGEVDSLIAEAERCRDSGE